MKYNAIRETENRRRQSEAARLILAEPQKYGRGLCDWARGYLARIDATGPSKPVAQSQDGGASKSTPWISGDAGR